MALFSDSAWNQIRRLFQRAPSVASERVTVLAQRSMAPSLTDQSVSAASVAPKPSMFSQNPVARVRIRTRSPG